MSDVAIRVSGLWKQYNVGAAVDPGATFYDVLGRAFMRGTGRPRPVATPFWALRDIDLEIGRGEVLGVIGRNGAGKSTLLKVLSRITGPTRGRAEVRGRLASLLEVGTGFHPELSGRENIFLNGSILGMSRAEVARKFDAIVEFAEIGKFIDTAVKQYSSGMYVRLAFAVAAHLDTDILIVDEVLAVGDAEFQQKCIGQMETIRNEGRTLLVVSHNMQLVKQLCPQAILLEAGQIVAHGPVETVQSRYLAGGATASRWVPEHRNENDPFHYESVEIQPPQGFSADAIPADRAFEIVLQFRVLATLRARLAVRIRNQFGVVVLTTSDTDAELYLNKRFEPGGSRETCVVPGGLLVPGPYWISVSRPLHEGNEILEDICRLCIDRTGSLVDRDYREGLIAPLLQWSMEKVQ